MIHIYEKAYMFLNASKSFKNNRIHFCASKTPKKNESYGKSGNPALRRANADSWRAGAIGRWLQTRDFRTAHES